MMGFPAGGPPGDGYTLIQKTTDQDVTNAQNVDDTALQFAVLINGIYVVQGLLLISAGDAAGDAEFRVAVSAGVMDGGGHVEGMTGAGGYATGMTMLASATSANNVIDTGADLTLPRAQEFTIAFRQSANAIFSVQFGNGIAGVGRISRMMAGSQIRYKKVA